MVHCDPSVAAPLEIIAGLANNRKMDKSSVLRSAIDFLKNHTESNAAQLSATGVENVDQSMSNQGPCDSNVSDSWKPCSLSYEEFAQLLLEVRTLLTSRARFLTLPTFRPWMRSY